MDNKYEDLTKMIARFIVGTNGNDIPPSVFEHAKIVFMDWLAVLLAGKEELLVLKLIRYTDLLGGLEQSTILGHGFKKSVSHAALINGSASHALDYDDTMKTFFGHPSVTIFPGLLAFAEWKEKTGSEFLTAYIVGLKAGACIGSCAGNEHYSTGWHATSTMGRLASAAGCAKLMALNERQAIYALGIAGTQASGLKRVLGTMCKALHAGSASQGGLMAAMLAEDDFTSAEDILEGPQGFFQAFKGKVDERAVGSLGKTWEIESLAQKYHASCHFTHSPIEAVLRIAQQEGLTYQDIKSIRIYCSQMGHDSAGRMEPKTGLEGKFSISYCVANALLRGETGMQAFTEEKVTDIQARKFMERISLFVDPEIGAMGLGARTELETNSGESYEAFVDVFEEIPDLETKKEKIKAKFMDICIPLLGEMKTEKIKEEILSLDSIINMKSFVEQI